MVVAGTSANVHRLSALEALMLGDSREDLRARPLGPFVYNRSGTGRPLAAHARHSAMALAAAGRPLASPLGNRLHEQFLPCLLRVRDM